MEFDLPHIWAAIIAFAVLMYVVLDGFDLGVGMLFAVEHEKHDRDIMMNSVAPVWDGNETWLVMGGGGLFAVFPLAYATVLPALYMPLTIMLLALVFRGVAFEYRWRTERGQFLWNWGFWGGSFIASFTQGIALGALVQGSFHYRPRLLRRLVGLADAVFHTDRCRGCVRLYPAWRDLADL